MTSFMMSLDYAVYELLEKIASERGLSVQELLRWIVGEWLDNKGLKVERRRSY